MTDKTPAIIAMLLVLLLIYLSNSGKLAPIRAIVTGPGDTAASSPPTASAAATAPSPSDGSDPNNPLSGIIGGSSGGGSYTPPIH